jgi:hypothetical protein
MLQFENDAGYSMRRYYALSYNGLRKLRIRGTGHRSADAGRRDYRAEPNVLANGGHGAGDDDNVVDLCR